MTSLEQIYNLFAKVGSNAPWFVVMIVFVAAMTFLVVPQLKRLSEHAEVLDNLKVGDQVVTSGGLVGRLTQVDGEMLQISFSGLKPIPVLRSAIEQTLPG